MWQVFIALYFVFGAANYLLRRVLAQRLGEYNRLVNAVFYLFFLLPTGVVLACFFPHNLAVGWLNIFFLFTGSIIFPVYYILAFNANKHVEAGIFVIINSLSPVATLAIALPFLHESLGNWQLAGVGLLIASGILAAVSQVHWRERAGWNGVIACLLCAAVIGIGVAFERFMLTRIDFGAYLIYGWGAQIACSAILTGRDLWKLPELFGRGPAIRRLLLGWGIASALRSAAFIIALKISSASLMSAASDFMSVAVVIAAYFFLREREHMLYKVIAVGVGVAGLLLIA